ncbi:MAG: major facilitator superfamily domain-containing protein [Piptocephalis tieghemiana]|nr:MAG: major facilitator superfamily domain-containing protein [Piptocephalis tieghemiana]
MSLEQLNHLHLQGKDVHALWPWLSLAYPLAQMGSGMMCGVLSDRVGRRPILLFSHLGVLVTMLLLSLDNPLPQTIVLHAACGLFQGALSVANAGLSDLTDGLSQSIVASLLTLIPGVSWIMGTTLSDTLMYPIHHHEEVRQNERLSLGPSTSFLVPGLLLSFVSLMGVLTTLLWFRESHVPQGPKKANPLHQNTSIIPMDRAPALACTWEKDTENALVRSSSRHTDTIPEITGLMGSGIQGPIMYLMIMLFLSLASEAILPVWMTLPIQLHGLGLEPFGTKLGLLLTSLPPLLLQLSIFSRAERGQGARSLYRSAMGFLTLGYFLLPWTSLLGKSAWIWPILFLILSLRGWGQIMAYASSTWMILDLAQRSSGRLGWMHGLSTSLLALSRLLAPMLGSLLWSYGTEMRSFHSLGSSIPWWILSSVAFTVYFLSGKSKRRSVHF